MGQKWKQPNRLLSDEGEEEVRAKRQKEVLMGCHEG